MSFLKAVRQVRNVAYYTSCLLVYHDGSRLLSLSQNGMYETRVLRTIQSFASTVRGRKTATGIRNVLTAVYLVIPSYGQNVALTFTAFTYNRDWRISHWRTPFYRTINVFAAGKGTGDLLVGYWGQNSCGQSAGADAEAASWVTHATQQTIYAVSTRRASGALHRCNRRYPNSLKTSLASNVWYGLVIFWMLYSDYLARKRLHDAGIIYIRMKCPCSHSVIFVFLVWSGVSNFVKE